MTSLLLILAKRKYKLAEALYFYRMNPDSLTQSSTIYDRFPYFFQAFARTRKFCEHILTKDELFLFDLESILFLLGTLFSHFHEKIFDMFTEYIDKSSIDMLRIIASLNNSFKQEKIKFFLNLYLSKSINSEEIKSELSAFDVLHFKKALEGLGMMEKKIVVWGAGERGKRLCSYLHAAGIPFAVTDTNASLYNATGVKVQLWERLKEQTDVVIITPKSKFDEIKAQIGDGIPAIDMETIYS